MTVRLLVPGQDLKEHFVARANHHRARVGELEVGDDDVEIVRAHRLKATYFDLLAKYVVTAELHELSPSDLEKIEMVGVVT
jgi:hypothetical protein